MLNRNQARIMEIDAEVRSLTKEGERLVAMLHSLKTQYDRGLISKAHFERTVEESKGKLTHIDSRVPQLLKEKEHLVAQTPPAARTAPVSPATSVPAPSPPVLGGPPVERVLQAVEEVRAMFKPVEERIEKVESTLGMVKNVDEMRRHLEGVVQRALNDMWREVEKLKAAGTPGGREAPADGLPADLQARLSQWKGTEERLASSLKGIEQKVAFLESRGGPGGNPESLMRDLMPRVEKAVAESIAARVGPEVHRVLEQVMEEKIASVRKEMDALREVLQKLPSGGAAESRGDERVALERLRLATEARLRLLEKRVESLGGG